MNNKFLIIRVVCATLFYLVCVGCYNSTTPPSHPENTNPQSTITIAELRVMAQFGTPFCIDKNLRIKGYVSATDDGENFYNSFIIDDGTGGCEIMARIDHLHNIYPEGQQVVVSAKDMWLGRGRGIIQLGARAAAGTYFEVDYLGSRAALDNFVTRGSENHIATPIEVTLGELRPELAGRLVKIESLMIADTDEEMNPSPIADVWGGYHTLCDASGKTIEVYMSQYSEFAGERIPQSDFAIVAILQFEESNIPENGKYILKPRRLDDIIY